MKHDVTEKALIANNDVFAEIIAENKKVNNHAYTRVIHDDQRLKPVSPSPK